MVNPQELVQLIVWLAGERGERLTTLRLVKFLYLADLYFARENGGLTLTGWPWAFVHFGPFCGEAVAAIDAAERQGSILAQKFASKYNDKDFRIFSIDDHEPPPLRETLPLYVLGPLQEAIRRWVDDTPGLLD